MSNLLSKASILLTPTAYSDGTLHSVKPNTTTGDFTFTRATTATRVNSNGLIESVASGLPRIDFTGGTGHIILEPASTNLFLNSSTLSTQDVTTSANSFTVSFYGTGSITLSGTHSATINGTGTNDRVFLTFTPSSGALTCTVSGTVTNAQIEQQSFATSYIPTSGSSATRNQDLAISAGDTSLINTVEGVLYTETACLTDGDNNRAISIGSNGQNIASIQYNPTSNRILGRYRNAGNFECQIQFDVADRTQFSKIAFRYKQDDFALFVNGVKVGTDTSGNVLSADTFTSLSLNSGITGTGQQFEGKIKTVAVYKEFLTDAQIISLTS